MPRDNVMPRPCAEQAMIRLLHSFINFLLIYSFVWVYKHDYNEV